MIKNRFFCIDGKSATGLYFREIKATATELFKHELRRQNVFGQN